MENSFIYGLETTKGLGFTTISRILNVAKTYDEFIAFKNDILKIPQMTTLKYQRVLRQKESEDFEKYKNITKKLKVELINSESKNYPTQLKNIPEMPYSLHLKGKPNLFKNKIVGIVGSRKSTAYGNEVAYKVAKILSNQGYTVISGLAKGIDAYAHKGALEGKGSTIAVIGSGLDCIYPKENTKLFLDISKEGLIISEFYLGTKPLSYNFPRRNRIISGLCDFLIVIEATHKSGSLITVNHAIKQGKDVLAVPGEIFSKTSEGTNMLIRDGAYPLISTNDLYEYLENNEN